MQTLGTVLLRVVGRGLLGLALVAPPLSAQTDARVVLKRIEDHRLTHESDPRGHLILYLEGAGTEVQKSSAFRLRVAKVADDTGTALEPEEPATKEWETTSLTKNAQVTTGSPARGAATISLSGTLELYQPSRDPAGAVRVERALVRAGRPLVSKGLKDAKVSLTVVPGKWPEQQSVELVGRTSELEIVRDVRLLRRDGTEVASSSRASGSIGEEASITLSYDEPVPPDATLVFSLITPKSILAVPFELKDVPLP